MPVFRATWMFEGGAAQAGWSESWYIDRATHSLAAADAALVTLTRRDLMNVNTFIKALRISNTDNLRDALYVPVSPSAGTLPVLAGTEENQNVGVLVDIRGDPTHHFVRIVRPAPAQVVNGTFFFDGGGLNWSDKFQTYIGALIAAGWMGLTSKSGFVPVVAGVIKGIATRRIGRPFFLTRGRRLRRRRRGR